MYLRPSKMYKYIRPSKMEVVIKVEHNPKEYFEFYGLCKTYIDFLHNP